ncbi:MAG: Gfo/Idh/MocA family oxidoreductase [Clostridiales bacterium]|nr:Gfo/Idh/MocA family oxidoreductase [Clostridiales bacterium]
MDKNPIIEKIGRRLRLAVIGGGSGSFIGATHRRAALLDGRYDVVAGALSSRPEKAISDGHMIGLPDDRIYKDATELIRSESERADGAEVIAIMTPNDSHFRYASTALDHGKDVICDKPMTNTLEDAEALYQKVRKTGLVFCLTHNYSGYPMVRQARAMAQSGMLGTLRLVQVEYVQGGKADENDPDPTGAVPWRYDPVRGGPSLVMGDIGTHAHHLVRFITELEVTSLTAEIGAIVPGRKTHDYAGALLRFENGARGCFWITQAAAGVENSLRIRVSGTQGTIEWNQEIPQRLYYKPLKGPAEIRTPNGQGVLPAAKRASRMVAGHPEGFHEAFATIYSDAAEAIVARRTGTQADPLALTFPTAFDGLMGVRFVHDVIRSASQGGKWVDCTLGEPGKN